VTVSRPVGGILSVPYGTGWPSIYAVYLGVVPVAGHRTSRPRPLFDLAPGGVYRADRVTPAAGALLPHRFTLTCAHPCGCAIGGLFSVALSCRSPRLAVNQHPALWSPDLPRPVPARKRPPIDTGRDHPAGSPSPPSSHNRTPHHHGALDTPGEPERPSLVLSWSGEPRIPRPTPGRRG